MKYSIIVQNERGDNLRVFDQDQFEDAIKYMECSGSAMLINAYRIQLVKKGPTE